jgi:hypothetical protein
MLIFVFLFNIEQLYFELNLRFIINCHRIAFNTDCHGFYDFEVQLIEKPKKMHLEFRLIM